MVYAVCGGRFAVWGGDHVGRRRIALIALVALLLLIAGISLALVLSARPEADDALGNETHAESPAAPERTYTLWSEDVAPNYYRVTGPAVVDMELAPGEIFYSGLDHLGRSGRAVACVTYPMMEDGIARPRDDISSIRPSGWGHNAEVDIELIDGTFYHGYMFNRSHLIAKSLGGDSICENLITGTRMQNVGDNSPAGGMLFAEQVARDWLFRNPDGWVLYSATPIYEGDELLARSVIVDIRSSDGTLDMQIEVYNAALGFDINYATGEFAPSDGSAPG